MNDEKYILFGITVSILGGCGASSIDNKDGDLANDSDGDGYLEDDCDDDNPLVHPDALEQIDGLDNDCDGVLHPDEVDLDGDGYVVGLIDGSWMGDVVVGGGDCDDTDPMSYPGALEQIDGLDNDCVTVSCILMRLTVMKMDTSLVIMIRRLGLAHPRLLEEETVTISSRG